MHLTSPPAITQLPPSSFPLDRIRLLPGQFKTAQDVDVRYVLELDADRLCAPYLRDPTAAGNPTGWAGTSAGTT